MENNRRFFLAIALTVLVIVATQLLFPPPTQLPTGGATADSLATAPGATTPGASAPSTVAAGAPAAPTMGAAPNASPNAAPNAAPTADSALAAAAPAAPVETVTVADSLATYRLSSLGAALVSAEMRRHRDLAPGHRDSAAVELALPGEALLSYRLVVPGDTVSLARTPFRATRAAAPDGGETVRFDGTATTRAGAALPVSITYTFTPGRYLSRVQGTAAGFSGPAFLLVDLPQTLRVSEQDSVDHFNNLAYAYKPLNDGAENAGFGRLDPGERELAAGPLAWAVAKSKYFIVGVLAPEGYRLDQLEIVGGVRASRLATRAQATVAQAMNNGAFAFDFYAGPQEWRRMVAIGRDFENANPYGGWMQGLVQPFATIVIRVLLWLHDALKLSYGWVLILLGVAVRLLMWPLQQKAMRSQLKMQRIQPELQAIQQRYKNEPQKLQTEMMRLYKDHGMSPFSALGGCLPMLIPMPIFFALFFVFQNTIEFRGVPFWYLPDISMKDPLYIMPILVAVTQFAVSYIAMKGAPPNPQMKMMTYMMPAMFLFFFLNVASGLNLYYLIQNVVSIPQQWLLTRERTKASPPQPIVQGTPVRPKRA